MDLMGFREHSWIDSSHSEPFFRWLWLNLVLAALVICGLCGCDDGRLHAGKAVPAPLAESFPYEISRAQAWEVWGGDNFEIDDNGLRHYLVLEGIDSPKPGQDSYMQSRGALFRMIREHKFRVVILRHDEMRREIAQVYIEDKNINLEMVKKGMAWWDGNEFEGVEKIKSAEKVARRKKIGLWKNPNAIHPSEFKAH